MWLGYFEDFPDYLTQGESPTRGHYGSRLTTASNASGTPQVIPSESVFIPRCQPCW